MTVTAGDIVKMVLEYAYPGAGTALNIFHFFYGGEDVEDADLMDVMEVFFRDEWGDHWAGLAPTNSSIDQVEGLVVDNAGLTIRDIGSRQIDKDGDLASDVNAAAVSGYLQGNTIVPQVRGSKYIPGLAEESIAGGVFTVTALVDLLLLLGDYLIDIEIVPGSSLRPGVLSSKEGGFLSFESGGGLTDVPAYQRRRKIGVGI